MGRNRPLRSQYATICFWEYLIDLKLLPLFDRPHTFPTREFCVQCNSAMARRVPLGLERRVIPAKTVRLVLHKRIVLYQLRYFRFIMSWLPRRANRIAELAAGKATGSQARRLAERASSQLPQAWAGLALTPLWDLVLRGASARTSRCSSPRFFASLPRRRRASRLFSVRPA